MNTTTRRKAFGVLALLAAGLALWVSRPSPRLPPAEAEEVAPMLPSWDAQSAHPMTELPAAPTPPGLVAEQAAHPERDLRQRADRYALALARGEFSGPEGAIALARTSPLVNDPDAQSALALALGAAVTAAAGENDFTTAEALLAQVDPSTASHPALREASLKLRARQAMAASDPARTAQIAADLAAIQAILSETRPDAIAAGFERLAAVTDRDPEHRGPTRLRQALVDAVRSAWSRAIANGEAQAEQAWATLALNYLRAGERSDLEAAARAAHERRQSPRP